MAVDREILVDKVTGQGEPEAYRMTPNNIPNYTAPTSLFEALNSVERQAKAHSYLKKLDTTKQIL